MGLDQWLLRGKHNTIPTIDDNGELVNAKELLQLRKCYSIDNKMMMIGMKKLGIPLKELNCKYIPLTKEELVDILEKSKECVEAKSEYLIEEYFSFDCGFSEMELGWQLSQMKEFNTVMSKYLRNTKETEYWYMAWW